ncbi:mitochondrial ribosomal protein S17 [Calliopsis andreniformis]|uniref:mitochondrial ribosomal protein S17 n=1 Tax=Calliopsis andreniformis TaxID=337506 RepID=UPI003FCE8C40
MAKKKVAKEVLTYLMGVCVHSPKQNAAKVRVPRLELDNHLLMYFRKHDFFYADDPEKRCKTGDIVLIQNLPEKLTRVITHKVVDVIYPLGDITDPITGKKVVAGKYREHISKDVELLGELESTFKYSEAPPRGKTRGVRDFSDKEIYVKYNDHPDVEPDPHSVHPL